MLYQLAQEGRGLFRPTVANIQILHGWTCFSLFLLVLFYAREKKSNSHLSCNSQPAGEFVYITVDQGISNLISESNMADPQLCTRQPERAKVNAEKYSVKNLLECDLARSSLTVRA